MGSYFVDLSVSNEKATNPCMVSEPVLYATIHHRSLQKFTLLNEATLLHWLVPQGHDGVVSINGDHDEVVIAQPETELTMVNSNPL